ncbi:hypothetical protein ACIP5Y_43650 [Nocardia sp. NPDC088792]|uniref:hypothetical protein n=1 Tax=Nocardia sp. NPDC088792 TaxID=3364332 RepID=UPI003819208F
MTARVGAVHLGWDVVSVAAGGGGTPIRPVEVEGTYTPPAYLLADSSGRLHTAGVDRRPDVGIAISDVRDIIGHPQIVVAGATWPAELVFRARMHNPLASLNERLGGPPDVIALPFPDDWPDQKVEEFIRLVEQLGVPAEALPESVALSGYVRALGLVRRPGRGPAVGAVGVYSDGRECLVVAVHGDDDEPTESVSVGITQEALHEARAADNVVIEVMAAARAINADTSTILLTGNVCFNDALRLAFQNHLGHRFQVADHPMHALVLGAAHLMVTDAETDETYGTAGAHQAQSAAPGQAAQSDPRAAGASGSGPRHSEGRHATGERAVVRPGGQAAQPGSPAQSAHAAAQPGQGAAQPGHAAPQPGDAASQAGQGVAGGSTSEEARPIEQGPRHLSQFAGMEAMQRQPEPLAQQPELIPRHMDSPPTGDPRARGGVGAAEDVTQKVSAEEAARLAAAAGWQAGGSGRPGETGSRTGEPVPGAEPADAGLTRRMTTDDLSSFADPSGAAGPTRRLTAEEAAKAGAGQPPVDPAGAQGAGVEDPAAGRGGLPPGLAGVGGRFTRPPVGSPADDQMTAVVGRTPQGDAAQAGYGAAGGQSAPGQSASGANQAGAQQGSPAAAYGQGYGPAGAPGSAGAQQGSAGTQQGAAQGQYGAGSYGGQPGAASGYGGSGYSGGAQQGTGGVPGPGGAQQGPGGSHGPGGAQQVQGGAQQVPGGAQQGQGGGYGPGGAPQGYNTGQYGPGAGGYGAQNPYGAGGYGQGGYGAEQGGYGAGGSGNAPGQGGAGYGGSMPSSGSRQDRSPENAAGQEDSESGSERDRKRKGKLWNKMKGTFGAPIVIGATALAAMGMHTDGRPVQVADATIQVFGPALSARPVENSCPVTPFASGDARPGISTVGDTKQPDCLRLGIDTLRYTIPGPARGIDPGPPVRI